MASISDLPGGRRKTQFTDSAGKRQTVYLSKVTHRHAEGWKRTRRHEKSLKSRDSPRVQAKRDGR
jgi:hypothetical protein